MEHYISTLTISCRLYGCISDLEFMFPFANKLCKTLTNSLNQIKFTPSFKPYNIGDNLLHVQVKHHRSLVSVIKMMEMFKVRHIKFWQTSIREPSSIVWCSCNNTSKHETNIRSKCWSFRSYTDVILDENVVCLLLHVVPKLYVTVASCLPPFLPSLAGRAHNDTLESSSVTQIWRPLYYSATQLSVQPFPHVALKSPVCYAA